jgi:hypothetical protein
LDEFVEMTVPVFVVRVLALVAVFIKLLISVSESPGNAISKLEVRVSLVYPPVFVPVAFVAYIDDKAAACSCL